MSRLTAQHIPILFILIGYLLIGSLYVIANPLWEAPDEIHHFPMVQYIQSHGGQLPVQDTVGLWQQEGNQPPLYYLMGALLISPLDTSDIDTVMRVNPHADVGVIRPDGNVNRIVHSLAGDALQGSVLATYILRFFSLLLGAGTVFVTYLIALDIFPDWRVVAVTAAGFVAFLPMFVYISASVNNDNLSNLLASLLLWVLVRMLKTPSDEMVIQTPMKRAWYTTPLRNVIVLGVLTGAGLLAKLSIGFMIPLVGLVLLIISVQYRNWRPLVIGGAISGGLTILIAGWWYWRNYQLFGDPTGLNRFLEIVGQRVIQADMAQLWTERVSFLRTFWGLFGSINVPMVEPLYPLLNFVGGLALVSGLVFVIRARQQWRQLALVLVWLVLTFGAFLRWTSITPASQGRLIYGAIAPIALLFALGLLWWLPKRWQTWVSGLFIIVFALLVVLQPIFTITPAYAIISADDFETAATFSAGDDVINMGAVAILTEQVTTGSYVELSVDFAVDDDIARNWSLFVHVVSPDEVIIGQRDVYPASGLLATEDIDNDFSWQNPIAVFVPPTTYTPMTAEIRLGWYHLPTGERMTLTNGSEMLTIGNIEIVPRPSEYDVPNPQTVNFGNLIELIGYDISDLRPMQGEIVELTLYWRTLQPIANDYVVFANIIEPSTWTKYADSNAMPVQWTRPTSTWEVGEIIEDVHTLTVAENAVPNVYELEVGLYLQEDGYPRLPVVGTYDDLVYLSRVRIEEASE